MTGGVSLLIPVSGLPIVRHHDEEIPRENIKKALEILGRGSLITLGIVVEGQTGGTVSFLHEPSEPVNTRAREALADLTGVHMLFTGPVMFTGVPEEKIAEVVSTRLSTVET